MADTGYDNHDPIIKNRAAGYRLENGKLLNAAYVDQSQPFSAGALYSTTGDLLRLDQALYDGKFLSPKTIEAMFHSVWHLRLRLFLNKQLNAGSIASGGVPVFPRDSGFRKQSFDRFVSNRITPNLRANNDLGRVFGEKVRSPRTRTAVRIVQGTRSIAGD